jgi:3-oxoacyl-[acyl-carrier-protein] synthase II
MTTLANGNGRRRVAVTGLGAVTPLGVGAATLFERWVACESGLDGGIGLCRDFDPKVALSAKEARRTDRFSQLGVAAAAEAVEQAGWTGALPADADRLGCVFGTGFGAVTTIEDQSHAFREGGEKALSPATIAMMMSNAPAGLVCMRYGLHGPSHSVGSACAAAADAIGTAAQMIAAGLVDGMVAGGSDAGATPLGSSATDRAGALSKSGVSRPFDARRDGFVLSEGGGAVVLEDLELARSRGAQILAELIGYGSSCDAFHLTAPEPRGRQAARAIQLALADAGLTPEDVDYVNAHGTGTELNDLSETQALKAAFGDHAYSVPVSSTKSVIGHLCGGAGGAEAVATVLSLERRIVGPTVNYEVPDEQLDLDYVGDGPRPLRARRPDFGAVAISNSFGFGGHNAVLCFKTAAWNGDQGHKGLPRR